MIPKVIHYCWFGRNPLPPMAERCIASWKKFLPDYEIKEWNEDNFDVNIIPYVKEAYEAKKYAFVSDYARFWILYYYGGLYFDTDVELLKNMDHIIAKGPFMGFEQPNEVTKKEIIARNNEVLDLDLGVNPGLGLGVTSGLELYKEILEYYGKLRFKEVDGTYNFVTIVKHTTDVLKSKGLILNNTLQCVAGVWIYPWDVFCPQSYWTMETTKTSNTVSIHLYSDSWNSPKAKFINRIFRRYPCVKTLYLKIRRLI